MKRIKSDNHAQMCLIKYITSMQFQKNFLYQMHKDKNKFQVAYSQKLKQ